jgi:hypothetical protein
MGDLKCFARARLLPEKLFGEVAKVICIVGLGAHLQLSSKIHVQVSSLSCHP